MEAIEWWPGSIRSIHDKHIHKSKKFVHIYWAAYYLSYAYISLPYIIVIAKLYIYMTYVVFSGHPVQMNMTRNSGSCDNSKSLRPSDALWRHRSTSTSARRMVWCPKSPSHYLDQIGFIIYLHLMGSSQDMIRNMQHRSLFKFITQDIEFTCPEGEWVNTNEVERHECDSNSILWLCNDLVLLISGWYYWYVIKSFPIYTHFNYYF